MKQSSIILMMLLLLVVHMFSQKTAFSVKAGLSSGNWGTGEAASQFENKFRIGLHTGVNADIPVVPRLTLQSELQYAMFGSIAVTEHRTVKQRANYLLMPVMVKYNLDNGLSFLCGPQAGVLVNASSTINDKRYDIKEGMKKTDVFIVFGVDYRVKSGFSLGFRYQNGWRRMENTITAPRKNQGFYVDLSYRFGNSFREMMDKIF